MIGKIVSHYKILEELGRDGNSRAGRRILDLPVNLDIESFIKKGSAKSEVLYR